MDITMIIEAHRGQVTRHLADWLSSEGTDLDSRVAAAFSPERIEKELTVAIDRAVRSEIEQLVSRAARNQVMRLADKVEAAVAEKIKAAAQ